MPRTSRLRPMRFDDTANRAPSAKRPVRSRARSLAMDTHIEPHQHAWSQFTYCASGLMQVTVMQGGVQTTFIVPSTRAVWIPPQVQHTVVVLEAAELRTVDIEPAVLPTEWNECRVLVVSKLLRELIHALEGSEVSPREDALMALTVDEMIRYPGPGCTHAASRAR